MLKRFVLIKRSNKEKVATREGNRATASNDKKIHHQNHHSNGGVTHSVPSPNSKPRSMENSVNDDHSHFHNHINDELQTKKHDIHSKTDEDIHNVKENNYTTLKNTTTTDDTRTIQQTIIIQEAEEEDENLSNLQNEMLFPKVSRLLPFGDGSNKIFGYENFGNTCYCNSVLQCLYHLDAFRKVILAYPTKPETMKRHRKLKMVGNSPRLFTQESFEPNNSDNNSYTNNTSSNTSYKTSDDNTLHDSDMNNDFNDNENDKTRERDPPKKTTFKQAFSKYGSEAMLTNSVFGDNASHSSKKRDDKRNLNKKSDNAHTIIMSSDTMTEKLHGGCKTIIVGRKEDDAQKSKGLTQKSNLSPISSTLQEHTKSDSMAQANEIPILNKSLYTSEQRKKAALIKGPVLNIDHMVNVAVKPNLYNALKDIFECITENENLTGIVSPTQFVKTLKKENVLFNSSMQQDAHEFLNFLLNQLNEYLAYHIKNVPPDIEYFILGQFQGTLSNKTKCLTCDTVTTSEEPFLDFPIEIKDDESIDIQEVLRHYHQREILNSSNKFYCNQCYGLQEAERLVGLKKLPKTLALHLKRFKYVEEKNANIKLFNKIYYPSVLSVSSTLGPEIPKKYELSGVVIHLGSSPQHGHYVSLCKCNPFGWLLFDDATVESVDESTVLRFTGDSKDQTTAYVLFYQEIESSSEDEQLKNMNGTAESQHKLSKHDDIENNETEEKIAQLIKCDDLIRKIKHREQIRLQQQNVVPIDDEISDDRIHHSVQKGNQRKGSNSSNKNKRKSRILSFMKP